VSHGECVRILIFEENANEATSLANLPGESGHPPHTDLACEPGKHEMAPVADNPDILICGAREASPDFEGETSNTTLSCP